MREQWVNEKIKTELEYEKTQVVVQIFSNTLASITIIQGLSLLLVLCLLFFHDLFTNFNLFSCFSTFLLLNNCQR